MPRSLVSPLGPAALASLVTLASLAGGGCGAPYDDSGPAVGDCVGDRAWLELPVRLALIRSDDATLTATATAPELAAVLDEVNALWAPACVRFGIESTGAVDTDPARVAAYQDALASHDLMAVARGLGELLPPAGMLDPGVGVFVFGSLGMPRLGRYFDDVDAVAWAHAKPDGTPTQPVLLAHELGHALGLPHYTGDDSVHNIMTASGGDPALMTELTEDQAQAARAQAATGDAR
jgi:hypothetical protein